MKLSSENFTLKERLNKALEIAMEGQYQEALNLALGNTLGEDNPARLLQDVQPLILKMGTSPFAMITKPQKMKETSIFSEFLMPALQK